VGKAKVEGALEETLEPVAEMRREKNTKF